jgi:RNA polymerase sigma-70 factor (ECF subfamily)
MKIIHPTSVNFLEGMNASEPSWLISECIAGNQAAIEMFVRRYEADVFRLALSILGDEAEAGEVAQETFIAALRSLRKYEDRKSLKAWLFTIALNISRSQLRKRKFLERLKSTVGGILRIETSKQLTPEEEILRTEKETAVWNELNQLDERHRTVAILRYFHELPIAEIAEMLSVNEGTIHSRLHTIRERLRDALQHVYGE